jgi:hypothetical protein
MKAGKTISELAQTVNDLRNRVRDFRLPQKFLRMNPVGLTLNTDLAQTDANLTIAPNRLMHEQLAERLGIPGRYYQKMATETPALLAANVNEWLTRGNGDKRFLRTYAGENDAGLLTGRAFLGSTYRPLDNYDLMTSIVPPMLDLGAEIVSSEVTESRLYIQAITRRIKSHVVVPGTHNRIDDVLHMGVIVSNSEVGGGSLSVRALVHRQVCTNGLVISEDLPGFKQVHIGRFSEVEAGAEQYLTDQTKKLRDAAVWSKAQDVLRAALSQATLDKITERINSIAGVTLQNPEKAVEIVAEKYDLVADERAAVMRNLISGGDVSQWGLTNAVTALANTVESYDRAVELEEIGGKIAGLAATNFGNN